MSDPVRQLYESRRYPAMSHPLSDPAVTAVAALLGGLETTHPSRARILEIGSCSGLNLIPLARRWPQSEFLGIDLSEPAVREARELAAIAEVANLRFQAADLRHFDPGPRPFDFIIAHGFLSWVPDDVKLALFAFCRRHLATNGIATISFNLETGWRHRYPVIDKARAILSAGADDPVHALQILRTVTPPESPEIPIIDDMLAKGLEILVFDDFGPVNDPWSLERFLQTATAAGLQWLGESDPAQNLPPNLSPEQIESLRQQFPDPLALQLAADSLTHRTFRSAILCRDDANLAPGICMNRLFEISYRAGKRPLEEKCNSLHRSFELKSSNCVPVVEIEYFEDIIFGNMEDSMLHRGILDGWLLPRIEPLRFDGGVPDFPDLGRWRREFLRRGLPVVDVWHRPCRFPAAQLGLLARIDGSHSRDALVSAARELCPGLACEPWLAHLAGRGLFLDL